MVDQPVSTLDLTRAQYRHKVSHELVLVSIFSIVLGTVVVIARIFMESEPEEWRWGGYGLVAFGLLLIAISIYLEYSARQIRYEEVRLEKAEARDSLREDRGFQMAYAEVLAGYGPRAAEVKAAERKLQLDIIAAKNQGKMDRLMPNLLSTYDTLALKYQYEGNQDAKLRVAQHQILFAGIMGQYEEIAKMPNGTPEEQALKQQAYELWARQWQQDSP